MNGCNGWRVAVSPPTLIINCDWISQNWWLDTWNHLIWFVHLHMIRVKFIPAPLVEKQAAFTCKLSYIHDWNLPNINFKEIIGESEGSIFYSVSCWFCPRLPPNIPQRQKTGVGAWFSEHLETSNYERLQPIVLPWQKKVGQSVIHQLAFHQIKIHLCFLNYKWLIYYPIFWSIWEIFFLIPAKEGGNLTYHLI